MIEDGAPPFKCPYCDYVGSRGYMHVKNQHTQEEFKQFVTEQGRIFREQNDIKDTTLEEAQTYTAAISEQENLEQLLGGIKVMEMMNRFTYHKPSPEAIADMKELRSHLCHIALMMTHKVPDGRERALAITKLEEAMMWANAGIARQFPFESPPEEAAPEDMVGGND